MEPQIVVRKSHAGMQEVFHRRAGLSPKMRTLLIMLNGTRSVEDLEKSLASLGDVRGMLYELNVLGLVEMEEHFEKSNVAGLGARLFNRPNAAPEPAYQPPAPQYADPMPQYVEPAPQYAEPVPQYFAPASQYAAPAPKPQPAFVSPSSQPAPAGAIGGMLGQLKTKLSAHMQRTLGDDYMLVRGKIDACQSIRDFANLLEGCEKVLASYAGSDAALALKKEFEGVM